MKTHQLLTVMDTIIKLAFAGLFLLVPLVFYKANYELFEYNKMMLTYGFTTIIVFAWVAKMVLVRKIFIGKTPLDIPILLFFISQVVSFFVSIDPHVSFWGYYSRFNGGLLSTIAYIVLYYALVSNISKNSKFETRNSKQYQNLNNKNSKQIDDSDFQHSNLFSDSDFGFRILFIALFSGFLISLYAIFEHFGHSVSCFLITGRFDVTCWVQDVKNRVYATLGQPNWLAAYLAILIPISLGTGLSFLQNINSDLEETQNSKLKTQNDSVKFKKWFLFPCYLLPTTYYLALLYTKSRSGFIGTWIGIGLLFVFFTLSHASPKKIKNQSQLTFPFKALLAIIAVFAALTFISKSPFEQINHYFSLDSLTTIITKPYMPTTNNPARHARPLAGVAGGQRPATKSEGPALETGGTDSGKIRTYVWQGAIQAFLARPLFGWGIETFAWVYYRFKPVGHNLTSEWDFLYNKAHNEYLNYAATSGVFGLGSYLLVIGWFVAWTMIKFKGQISNIKTKLKSQNQDGRETFNFELGFDLCILIFALFSGWITILVTNFFGFSVVVVNLFFWLIPAICLVMAQNVRPVTIGLPFLPETSPLGPEAKPTVVQLAGLVLISLIAASLLFSLTTRWIADTHFASGYALARQEDYTGAYREFARALDLNFSEPLYHDEFASTLASLTVLADETHEATLAAKLADLAIASSDKAISISPQNVSFWKTRTRVFYTLAQLDKKYNEDALKAIEIAQQLAPTDPKVVYNKALLLSRLDRKAEAEAALVQALALKPDYRDPRLALAVFYHESGEDAKAKKELNTILKIVGPDEEVQKMLGDLDKKK